MKEPERRRLGKGHSIGAFRENYKPDISFAEVPPMDNDRRQRKGVFTLAGGGRGFESPVKLEFTGHVQRD